MSEILRDPALSMTQLLQALKTFDAAASYSRSFKVGISSSVTAELLGTYLRKHAALHGQQLLPVSGNYDDPLGDMQRFAEAGVDSVVLLPFLDNLLPALEAQLPLLDPELLAASEAGFGSRLQLALEASKGFSAVWLGTFHRIGESPLPAGDDEVDRLVERLNATLRRLAAAHAHVRIIDTQQIIANLGRAAAFDMRFYYRAKAPWSARYFDAVAAAVSDSSRGFGTSFHKVLVLDCDNTLWGGILGEDGVAGIALGAHDYPGNVFWRVQHEIARLEQNGVLLCLCSKNNAADVDEAFAARAEMVLKPGQIVARRVNWNDKAQNLRELAAELNLGLDSMVFLDDSEFECAAVRSQLPQVHTVQVPKNLSDYPRVIGEIGRLFLGAGVSAESRSKTRQYQERAEGLAQQAQFGSQEDYLRSLGLRVQLRRNPVDAIPRISELSKKSNQFNVTTRRYSEAELSRDMTGPDSAVYALWVADRFGEAGLTGVVVMRYAGASAYVEAFFMSCRVIGRGVEFAIWKSIAEHAAAQGCGELLAEYLPTGKNSLVARFFDELGMQRIETTADAVVKYRLALPAATLTTRDWIELTHA